MAAVMASEKIRLEYLKRMGITSYVPRRQLEGAKPSVRLIPTGASASTSPVQAIGNNAASHSLESVKALLNRSAKAAAPEAAPTSSINNTGSSTHHAATQLTDDQQVSPAIGNEPSHTTPASSPNSAADALKAKISQGTSAPKPNNAANEAKSASSSDLTNASPETDTHAAAQQTVHLSVFKYQNLSVVCELVNSAGIYLLSPEHRVLIADAIRLMFGHYNPSALKESELHWPLPGRSLSNSRGTASDLVSGFLDAETPELVLSFGDCLTHIEHNQKVLSAPSLDALCDDSQLRVSLADTLVNLDTFRQ